MKKNDIIDRLEITDMTAEGNGVGHIPDGPDKGIAVFISGAVPGDVISCRIVKVLKNMCFGIIEKLIIGSDKRDDRGCAVNKSCGGCVFRHISYEAEAEFKHNIVKNAFLRLGRFDENCFEMLPVMGCTKTDHYRNKAQFPVSADKDGRLISGFYAQRSHRIVPCTECMLQPEIFSDIVKDVLAHAEKRNIPAYSEETGKGVLRHIYIRQGYHSGEIMVCVVSASDKKKLFADLADELMKKYSNVTSVIMNVNTKRTNVILGSKCITLGGNDCITDTMCGNTIRISPLSFYQVNTAQAEKLYAEAADFAGLTGNELLLDLYCGAGTIGLSMASKAKSLIGAEIVPEAVENAKENAAANGISNARFICADAGEAAKLLADEGTAPDVIVTDPPRKGCGELALDSIVKMSPKRIVMVSCNPATAARDCRYLADRGYSLVKVRAVDLFPGTGHVETVCLLSNE